MSVNSGLTVSVKTANDTISILTTYAFPKISEYYSSKQQQCILDQHRDQIVQYFRENQMIIQNFYNSTIKKTQFIHDTIKFIDQQNGTRNGDNYSLQTALKKLYTILQIHQYINKNDKNIKESNRNVTTCEIQQTKRENRKSVQMDMVYALSKSESQILTLQQRTEILQDVAKEQQKELMEAEQKGNQYKQRINYLEQELNAEKTCVSQTKHLLKETKTRMLRINGKLNDRVIILEDQNNKLKQVLIDNQKWMIKIYCNLTDKMAGLQAENERLKRLIFEKQCQQQQNIMNSNMSESFGNVKLKGNDINMSTNNNSTVDETSFVQHRNDIIAKTKQRIKKENEYKWCAFSWC